MRRFLGPHPPPRTPPAQLNPDGVAFDAEEIGPEELGPIGVASLAGADLQFVDSASDVVSIVLYYHEKPVAGMFYSEFIAMGGIQLEQHAATEGSGELVEARSRLLNELGLGHRVVYVEVGPLPPRSPLGGHSACQCVRFSSNAPSCSGVQHLITGGRANFADGGEANGAQLGYIRR